MPEMKVNGVNLYYELHGEGEPLVLVHGSWVDASSWALVLPALSESFSVLIYDRRGHSRSEQPEGQGSIDEDGDDLAALIEELDLAPAHVVTNSFGGSVALRLATRRGDLFRSLACHEPPLWGVLADDAASQGVLEESARNFEAVAEQIAAGDHEGAARYFIDNVVFGPGAWESVLPPEARAVLVQNAPTFLDEIRDPDVLQVDQAALGRLEMPVRLTNDPQSPPLFGRVIDRLRELIPHATHETMEGATHAPHVAAPERYVELTKRVLQEVAR